MTIWHYRNVLQSLSEEEESDSDMDSFPAPDSGVKTNMDDNETNDLSQEGDSGFLKGKDNGSSKEGAALVPEPSTSK